MLRATLFCISLCFLPFGNVLAGGSDEAELELIMLESLSRSAIVFQAKSNGCTQSEDFRIALQGLDLSVLRVKPDRCRRLPFWKAFTLAMPRDFKEERVLLMNPLVVRP